MTGSGTLSTVRVVVCDDEPLARKAMQEYLRHVTWVDVVGTAADGREALRVIHKLEPDLVFLDVRMPGLSGVDVLAALQHRPAIVFTTAYDEYAVAAFEHGAVDYLVKPFGRGRVLQTLDRVRVRLVGEARAPTGGGRREEVDGYAERVFARHRGAMVPISVPDIRRLEAVDGGVVIHAGGRTLHLDATLGEVASRLDPGDFVRIHRSHLVNLAYVQKIGRYDDRRFVLTLDDGASIIASRGGTQALRELMG